MMKHVLVVDDDALMRRSVAFNLKQAGYSAATAGSAEDALVIIQAHLPDVILLDIGLPGMDGLEALRAIQRRICVPVVFVTARRRELDEIVGLELGADDYITKPFDMDVLLAHIKAVLRRVSPSDALHKLQQIVVGDLFIDPTSHVVQIGEREIALPPKEFDILLVMAQEAGHVLSVDDLLARVWGAGWVGESQTIYVHVRWLREKIEHDPAHPRRLVTIKGAGYKLMPVTG
jgi:DNA-binding response OmpR family regulator